MSEFKISLGSGRRKPQISLTPLIDVLFILLIFFMVTSSFEKASSINIDLPSATGRDNANKDIFDSHIEVAITKEEKLFVNGKELLLKDLEATIRKIISDHQKKGDIPVYFKVDKGVSYGLAIEAMGFIRSGGAKTVLAMTEGE